MEIPTSHVVSYTLLSGGREGKGENEGGEGGRKRGWEGEGREREG